MGKQAIGRIVTVVGAVEGIVERMLTTHNQQISNVEQSQGKLRL